jgi:uncharacterized protein YceH (UPF0502 family)
MKIELTPMEARVIGCLIEKQITTPDQYPLSLNALVNACNQKTNRDPVMDASESDVQKTLDALSKKHFVIERSGFGSRVPKYQHRFCNTEFGTLKFTSQELAIVCELLLRGPQTPGELRSRASRMAPFADVSEVEAALETLRTRDDGPFVARLAREPGRRESRYAHLFSGAIPDSPEQPMAVAPTAGSLPGASSAATASSPSAARGGSPSAVSASAAAGGGASAPLTGLHAPSPDAARMDRLEAELKQLRAELDDLKQRLGG